MSYLLGILSSLFSGDTSPLIIGGQEFTLAILPFLFPLLILAAGIAIQVLFPRKTVNIGPRVDDLTIVTSTYGDHLARVYGRARIAGAVIWVEGNQVKEITTTTVTKQKLFGFLTIGKTTTTEFTYTATFAIGFTVHQISDFGKIFIDDEIHADLTSTTSDIGIPVRSFKGTINQIPPFRMVEDNGADETPGYRGISFLFFTDLPLDEIGIRIPNVEAEVIVDATPNDALNLYPNTNTTFSNPHDIDWANRLVSNIRTEELVLRLRSREIIWHEDLGVRDSQTITTGAVMDNRGNLFIPEAATNFVHIYDAFTSKFKELTLGFLAPLDGQSNFSAWSAKGFDPLTEENLTYMYIDKYGTLARTDLDGSVSFGPFGQSSGFSSVTNVTSCTMRSPDSQSELDGKAWLGAHTSNNPRLIEQNLSNGSWTTYNIESLYGMGNMEFASGVCYIDLDDTLIIFDPANNRLIKVAAEDPTVILKQLVFTGPNESFTIADMSLWSRLGPTPDGRLSIVNFNVTADGDDALIWIIDAVGLEIIEIFSQNSISSNTSNFISARHDVVIDDRLNALVFAGSGLSIAQLTLPRSIFGRVSIASIIQSECLLAGIDISQIDVAGITGDTIGYAIKDSTTPRAVIEDINRVKSKEFAQVDGVLRFVDKAVAPVQTIFLKDTGVTLSGTSSVTRVEEEIADPTEIPKAVTLEYLAFDANYRIGAQKITVPDGLDQAKEHLRFTTNMTLTDDEAAQSADIILLESRDVSLKYNANILPKYSNLHPGDVVTLELDEARSENVVLREVTQDVMLETEYFRRQFDFVSNAIGNPINDGTFTRENLVQAIFQGLDIPILRIIDDDAGFYWGLYTQSDGTFNSAIVDRSADLGATFDFFGSVNTELVALAAVGTLAGDITKAWKINDIDTLDVSGLTGAIATVTLADTLNGENLFAIQNGNNWELASAQTVTDITPNRYTLTNWIRGRWGTENYIDGHAVGDLLFRLNSIDIAKLAGINNVFRSSEDSKDVVYDYLARTAGIPSDSFFQTQFTNTAVGKRPYAPWPVEATRDGSENLDITWFRRDRLYHHWLGGTIPLSEDSEEYEIDIFEGMTALDTITGLTSPLFEYTLTAYKADSGNGSATVIPTLTVFVYQISVIYGRGEAIEVDL